MRRDRPRWSEAAEDVRRRGPAWLDLDRSPWWSWLVAAVAGGAWGVRTLVTADVKRDATAGLVLAVLLPVGGVLGARARRRGQAVMRPPDRPVGARLLGGVLVLLLVAVSYGLSGMLIDGGG